MNSSRYDSKNCSPAYSSILRCAGRLIVCWTVLASGCKAPHKSASEEAMSAPTAPKAQEVRNACETNFSANSNDCNKFLKAVSNSLGSNIPQDKDANGIVDFLENGNGWTKLPVGNGSAAKQQADAGMFVVAGLRGPEHADHRANGHVCVIVSGELDANGFPRGYWGSITPGLAKKDSSIRKVWRAEDVVNVRYYYKSF